MHNVHKPSFSEEKKRKSAKKEENLRVLSTERVGILELKRMQIAQSDSRIRGQEGEAEMMGWAEAHTCKWVAEAGVARETTAAITVCCETSC